MHEMTLTEASVTGQRSERERESERGGKKEQREGIVMQPKCRIMGKFN